MTKPCCPLCEALDNPDVRHAMLCTIDRQGRQITESDKLLAEGEEKRKAMQELIEAQKVKEAAARAFMSLAEAREASLRGEVERLKEEISGYKSREAFRYLETMGELDADRMGKIRKLVQEVEGDSFANRIGFGQRVIDILSGRPEDTAAKRATPVPHARCICGEELIWESSGQSGRLECDNADCHWLTEPFTSEDDAPDWWDRMSMKIPWKGCAE